MSIYYITFFSENYIHIQQNKRKINQFETERTTTKCCNQFEFVCLFVC